MSCNIPWSDEGDQQVRSLALSGFSLAEIAHQMVRGKSRLFAAEALKFGIAIARDRETRCKGLGRRPPAYRARAEGEGEMKGWKWAGDLRVQICIIVALIFVIWMVLQQQYY